jgi:hypothetical protein
LLLNADAAADDGGVTKAKQVLLEETTATRTRRMSFMFMVGIIIL